MDTVGQLRLRAGVLDEYHDVLTPGALETIAALAPFDARRRALMQARIERRAHRRRDHERIGFLPDDATIGGTNITVSDARAGRFDGGLIPDDLQAYGGYSHFFAGDFVEESGAATGADEDIDFVAEFTQ